ncbi:MAG: hypothetical protein E5V40_32390, partial [Mesorhizobium sp.]
SRLLRHLCSTYGEGNPRGSARSFVDALEQQAPDLGGVRFALFGLGTAPPRDGGLATGAPRRAARREYGRHDGSGRDYPPTRRCPGP